MIGERKMTNEINTYDKLYDNMRQRFTVSDSTVKGYTLGDYMLLKANAKKEAALPVAAKPSAVVAAKSERAVSSIVNFVNDKLTIKEPPVKDKTIRAFPMRASLSALLSAAVACAFIFSFCLIGAKIISTSSVEPAESAAEYTAESTPETANHYFE